MRKRIAGLFLAVCLVISMLPLTSLASAYMVHSYEEWLDAIVKWPGGAYEYGFEISTGGGFTWPEEDVTLTIEKNLYVNGTWQIPENVTVVNHAQVTGDLSVEGTWNNETKQLASGYQTGSVAGNVTVGSSGTFYAQNNGKNFNDMTVEDGGTLHLGSSGFMRIDPAYTLTLAPGANVDGSGTIQLGGTLHGEGVALPQAVSVTVNGVYSGTQADAVISGDVTVSSMTHVSSGTLTIPSGSTLTCRQISVSGTYTGADTVGILQIDGALTVTGAMQLSGESGTDAGRAEVRLGSGGVLAMQPNAEISSLSPSASITGDGTLRLNAPSDEAGNPYNWPDIIVDYTRDYIDTSLDLALDKGYLADTVTIWKSWTESQQCEHAWVAGTTVEPTCTQEGYTLYTCSKCMATEARDTKPSLGHEPDGNTDCSKPTLCTRCAAVLIPEGHQWEADTSQENRIVYACTRCGEETVYELTLEDDIQIDFNSEALASLTQQALDLGCDTILIRSGAASAEELTKAQQETAEALSDDIRLFDVTMQAVSYDANGEIEKSETLHNFDGSAAVRLPYDLPSDMTGRELKACYLSEDGEAQDKAVSYENGLAVLTADHFSCYGVYTAKTASTPGGTPGTDAGSQTGTGTMAGSSQAAGTTAVKTGDTGNPALWLFLLLAAAAAGCAGITAKKRP